MGQCQICNKSTLPDEDVELSEEKECMSKSLVNLKIEEMAMCIHILNSI